MGELISIGVTLEAGRELTDSEVMELELAMVTCLERFGIEEWALEVQHDFAECPACENCEDC